MYLSYEKYQELGGLLGETEFNELLSVAEPVINYYCFGKIHNIEDLSVFKAEAVEKATYYEIEYINRNGGVEAVLNDEDESEVEKEDLGDYSVTYREKSTSSNKLGSIKLCFLASIELDNVCLRSRSIY
jgi:hypothetical protein